MTSSAAATSTSPACCHGSPQRHLRNQRYGCHGYHAGPCRFREGAGRPEGGGGGGAVVVAVGAGGGAGGAGGVSRRLHCT